MRTSLTLGWLGWLALAACNSGSESSDTYTTLGCTPGEQRACACPGGQADGVQVCAEMGDHYEACLGCSLGDGGVTTSAGSTGAGEGSSGGAESTSAPPPASTSEASS